MRRVDSLEKTLMLGKIEGRRRRGQQRLRWLDGITDSVDMTLCAGRLSGTVLPFRAEQGSRALCQAKRTPRAAFPSGC